MSQQFTTIRVYEKDKTTLVRRYGGPAHQAFAKAINDNCPHPEESRSYLAANLPTVDEAQENRRVGGFYCEVCGRYIFKK